QFSAPGWTCAPVSEGATTTQSSESKRAHQRQGNLRPRSRKLESRKKEGLGPARRARACAVIRLARLWTAGADRVTQNGELHFDPTPVRSPKSCAVKQPQ